MANEAMGAVRPIRVYFFATLILMSIALAFYFSGFEERYPEMVTGLAIDPAEEGTDLTIFDRYMHRVDGALVLLGKGTDEQFNYGPLSAPVITFFLTAFPDPVWALTVFGGTSALIAALLVGWEIRENKWAVAALVLAVVTSYPFLFLFERGNIEGVSWAPTGAGLYCLLRKRYLAAALLIGMAADLKPYPGLFLLLLLPLKKFREFAAGVAVTLAIAVASLAYMGPDIWSALKKLMEGFHLAQVRYATFYRPWEIFNDHSLFGLYKQLLRLGMGWPDSSALTEPLVRAYPYYALLAGAILAGSVYKLCKLPILNQIFGLTILTVLIPPYNYDYTLIALYIPWAILLVALSRKGCSFSGSAVCAIMLACAVVFTSQYYLLFGTEENPIGFGGQIKCVALAAILLVSVCVPLPMEQS
jgi:hypothetical protein